MGKYETRQYSRPFSSCWHVSSLACLNSLLFPLRTIHMFKPNVLTSSRLVGLERNKDTPQRQWAIEARARVEEGRTATRNRNVGNLLRWEYDKTNQEFDPYKRNAPREPPINTKGDFPEKRSKSAGSNDARGWPTVDLEQATTTYVEYDKLTIIDPE